MTDDFLTRGTISQPKQEHVVDDSGCCKAIHYPECWDTAAYPTVNDALAEMFAWFKCDNVDCAKPQAVARGDEPKYHYNYSTALMNIEFEAFEDGFIVLKSEEGWHFKVAIPTTEKYSPLPQPEAAKVALDEGLRTLDWKRDIEMMQTQFWNDEIVVKRLDRLGKLIAALQTPASDGVLDELKTTIQRAQNQPQNLFHLNHALSLIEALKQSTVKDGRE